MKIFMNVSLHLREIRFFDDRWGKIVIVDNSNKLKFRSLHRYF